MDESFAHEGIKPQRTSDNSRRGSFGFCQMNRYWLRWRDVVARSPCVFAGDAVEIFFNKLFPPRKAIATAHQKIMADRGSVWRTEKGLRSR
jgi:hypothetical protein